MLKKAAQVRSILWVGVVACMGTTIFAALVWPQPALSKASPSLQVPTLAQSRTSPPVPPLPGNLPAAQAPNPEGIVGLSPDAGEEIGVGHLRPRDLTFLDGPDWTSSPYLGANWLQAAAIPIYVEPNGLHWGWIVNGWLVPNGQAPIALGRDASFSMLHTYYALFSFPVTQIQEDGWFEFQYTPAGRAWAHVDHLNLGRLDLAIERWENRFLENGWIEFRRHGLSQPLYASLGEEQAAIQGLIGPESFIEPLAFEGDWMQVRVTQPADGCTFLAGAVSQEGWMRWRNAEGRSLIWYPPKGC